MQNFIRSLLAVVVVVLVGGVGAKGSPISSFGDLLGSGSRQAFQMPLGPPVNNLMERVDGADFIVEKGEGEYHVGFFKKVGESWVLGAYLDTDNSYSDNYSVAKGWCSGLANRDVFLEEDSPDYVVVAYDPDGGDFAELDGGLDFDENCTLWESGYNFIPGSGLIEYDGVVGGLLDFAFPANDGSIAYVDSIVLVPEPATMVLLAFGGVAFLRRRRCSE